MLLDTHVLLWFLSDDEMLPRLVKQQIEDEEMSVST
ncbi:MAG: type II toxin-antitoxin system VapC family toxin [Microcoleus sp. SM1_3_4]|nr:type II toxin-antitoxin system VapC family toxin [Microcoleus sp. SM1_3_4]